MANTWDRAVAAEARRCRRLGLIPQQPDGSDRRDEYETGELIRLSNVRGPLATYKVGPTGRVARISDVVSAGTRASE